MKVYQLNEYEWWAGKSLFSALRAAMDHTGLDVDEIVDDPREMPKAMTDEQMAKVIFTDDGGLTGEEGKKVTFADALELMIKAGEGSDGNGFPFASTEW